MGWLLIGAGLVALVAAVRIPPGGTRGIAQGAAVLIAAIGAILLMRRPGAGLQLPGYGQRQWRQP
jgi:hypothetical protein